MIATAEYTISKIYDGQPGQPGSPGASVSSITRYYTISTSPTQLINPSWADPDEPEWTTTQPSRDAIDATHYLWQKDVTTLSDGNTIESNAWCERIISGIISQVNYDAGIIEQAVWEDYTDTQIDAYDGSTITTLRNRTSAVEQTVNGYDVTVSGQTTHVDGLTERMTSAEGRLSVNENAITAMVTLDDQSSSLTLTNNMIEAMTNQFIIKGSDNTTTVISGGKIVANTIKTNDLATDAIKSSNYVAPTGVIGGNGTAPFSVSGSFFNLTDGKILTPYFALIPDSTDGNGTPVTGTAYLNGTIETESGHIGGFVITENAIYHNKIDVTSVDLSDDIYIINNDPYILDEEDYLYGGYASLYEVYMGTDGISCGFGKFAVDSTGELFASNATIKGNITATSGSFGTSEGYYQINNNRLIGYKVGTVYYYKLSSDLPGDVSDWDRDRITIESLSLVISLSSGGTVTYSYNDILVFDDVRSVEVRIDDNNNTHNVVVYVKNNISFTDLFGGTFYSLSGQFSYILKSDPLAIHYQSFSRSSSAGGTPISINVSNAEEYITGTELGYDFLKTKNLIADGGKIGNWTISNGILTASGTWEDYQDWDWSYTMDIQPGSLDMSYYVLRDEEGNTVPENYYAGHTSIENDYISLFSQASGSSSDETIIRPGEISTTYITTYQIGCSMNHDLIISSNDATWACRLTQYGSFRPGGVDSTEDSQATGQQYLGTANNRWKQLYCTTAPDVSSDIKTKDNIEEIGFSETFIRNLKPISFMLKNSDHRRKHMGFIAQDISQLCKDIGENLSVVSASYKDEYEGGREYLGEDIDDDLLIWGMAYDELIAPMVLEIQRLMDRVDKLEYELNELKGVNR